MAVTPNTDMYLEVFYLVVSSELNHLSDLKFQEGKSSHHGLSDNNLLTHIDVDSVIAPGR